MKKSRHRRVKVRQLSVISTTDLNLATLTSGQHGKPDGEVGWGGAGEEQKPRQHVPWSSFSIKASATELWLKLRPSSQRLVNVRLEVEEKVSGMMVLSSLKTRRSNYEERGMAPVF